MPGSDGRSHGAAHRALAPLTRRASAWALSALLVAACTRAGSRDEASPIGPDGSGPDAAVARSGASGSEGGTAGRSQDAGGTTGDTAAESGAGGEDAPAPDGAGHLPYTAPDETNAALPARAFKLSHAEYARSVAALLGKPVEELELEPELDNGVYPHMSASGIVRTALARDYYGEAKRLTDALTEAELARLVDGGELVADAAPVFVKKLVEKAFRRPATDAERTTYEGVFELGASEGSLGLGFRSVLRALLTAPQFLYRSELGRDADAAEQRLTDHEVASLLSYALLGEPPSDALLASAARGELTRADTLEREVRALVESPGAAQSLATFASEWLRLERFQPEALAGLPPQPEKDREVGAGFDAVRSAMRDEATAFLAANAAPGASLRALLTEPVPLTDPELAAFYASEPSADGRAVRTGVLALGSLLAVYASEAASSPTRRGHFVRERLLCQELTLPGAQPPPLETTREREQPATTRALYELHAAAPACAGCHALLDNVGFAFESFDAVGRPRASENGTAVDTRFELFGTDVDGTYADHSELAAALAGSEWVRECVATQLFRRYFGELEPGRGVAPIQAARRALADGTFADALTALFTTESTYLRRRE
jgi:hypothetical protein